MSDEFHSDEIILNEENEDEECEDVSSEEVDQVVSVLEGLIEKTESENICYYLQEASNFIYYLVYADDEEEDSDSLEAA